MQLNTPFEAQGWDRFKAFHSVVGSVSFSTLYTQGFIRFDTDEVIFTLSDPRPNYRHHYKDLNVTIALTVDKDCPRLFMPDGTPVKKSWLDVGGSQALLIDHDSKRVVGLRTRTAWMAGLDTRLPIRFKDVAAYIGGAGALPVGAPITLRRPNKITPEQRRHVRQLVEACKTWAAMEGFRAYEINRCFTYHELETQTFATLDVASRRYLATGDAASIGTYDESYYYLTIS